MSPALLGLSIADSTLLEGADGAVWAGAPGGARATRGAIATAPSAWRSVEPVAVRFLRQSPERLHELTASAPTLRCGWTRPSSPPCTSAVPKCEPVEEWTDCAAASPGGRSDPGENSGAMRVAVADDRYLLRDGMVRLIEDSGHEVAATGPETLAALLKWRPDVAALGARRELPGTSSRRACSTPISSSTP